MQEEKARLSGQGMTWDAKYDQEQWGISRAAVLALEPVKNMPDNPHGYTTLVRGIPEYHVLDVFVLTGQSNSLGTVEAGAEPPPKEAENAATIWWSNVRDVNIYYGDSGGSFLPLQAQQGDEDAAGGNTTFWGPEIGFGQRLHECQPQRRIAIVKVARGGGGSDNWLPSAHMFRHVRDQVTQAAIALEVEATGVRVRIRALLYVQGESDADFDAPASGARLLSLLHNLRREWGTRAAETVAVIGGIATRTANRVEKCDVVRASQAALAVAHPAEVAYVDNSDLVDALYDELHFDRGAKLSVGERLADALIAMEAKGACGRGHAKL